jgi:hypothetical protein
MQPYGSAEQPEPVLEKPVSREIFDLYLRIQTLAQASFAELPPDIRGTLRCAISDTRFTLPMWDQDIQEQPIEAAFILIRHEAGTLAGSIGPTPNAEKVVAEAIERAKDHTRVIEAMTPPVAEVRRWQTPVRRVLDMIGDSLAGLSDAPRAPGTSEQHP